MARLTTRELSKRTFDDFAHFFTQVHGCHCTLYLLGRHLTPLSGSAQERARLLGAPDRSRKHFPHRDLMRARELEVVRELVEEGKALGVLVYADGEPVGWGHYGRTDEIPVHRDDSVPPLMFARDPGSRWRINCFVTRIDHRRQGVATRALKAVIAAIRKRGGGWVEVTTMAFPHHDPLLPKLRRTFGWASPEVADHIRQNWPSHEIPGIGRLNACGASSRTLDHAGRMSMYEKVGFQPVARDPYRSSDDPRYPWHFVLMRLEV